jgi:hypothetical protein
MGWNERVELEKAGVDRDRVEAGRKSWKELEVHWPRRAEPG